MHVDAQCGRGRVVGQTALLAAHSGQAQTGAAKLRGERQIQVTSRSEFFKVLIEKPVFAIICRGARFKARQHLVAQTAFHTYLGDGSRHFCHSILLSTVILHDRAAAQTDRCPPPNYVLASYTILKGVSVARRKRLNPADRTTSSIRFSPACAPRHRPTSCDREHGVHSRVEKE